MSKLKELLKQHDLTTGELTYSARAPMNVDELNKFYGKVESYKDWNSTKVSSVWLECKGACKDHHYLYQVGSYWYYRWPGQTYLIAKALVPIDILHEVCKAKENELEAARKKRFETIKSARDAVRVTFRDLSIKHDLVNGDPRVDLGPVVLEFAGAKDSPKVEVSFTYKTGYNGYLQKETLIELTVADPTFNQKVQAIVNNGKNLKKLMLGEAQPENVSSAK